MSDSSVVGDITNTLVAVLKNHQALAFDVSAHQPTDDAVPGGIGARVNVFLFRIVENPFLKNEDWIPEGRDTQRYPPLYVDLFYLLTAFANENSPGLEHQALTEAMRVLHDFNPIPEADLQGSLAQTRDEIETETWQLSLEDLSRIWSALTKPYRLSVGYVVRNLAIDSTVTRQIRRVVEKRDEFEKMG
jgi:hypothetical protein